MKLPDYNYLDLNYVFKSINQAYEIPSIQVISLTGGEPTLFPDILKQVLNTRQKWDL